LYAAGEVACTGAQGANRLASNSLLECLVFGKRAAEAALRDTDSVAATWQTSALAAEWPAADSQSLPPALIASRLDADLGVERTADELAALLRELPESHLSTLIARAAWLRTESRGAHFRVDRPSTDSAWRGRIHWRRHGGARFESLEPPR